MTSRMWASVAGLALVSVLFACAHRPIASQATVDEHVSRARALAGEDLQYLMPVCQPQPAQRPGGPAVDALLKKAMAQTPPEPGQVFDNLYYVGSAWVSAWVLKTSDGLILIDALNNTQEARDIIETGFTKLGLNLKDVKYLLVTHGHGDHYGGAVYLVEKYGMRVVASEVDWQMMETQLEFDSPVWDRPPKRDMAVRDGDRLTLGDTTVTFYLTPGHTLGTLSPAFPVRTAGKTYQALMWGGTSFNFGRDLLRLDRYAEAANRMVDLTDTVPFEALISNHPGWDNTIKKMSALKQHPQGPHPFVSGRDGVLRSMRILQECSLAQKDRFLMTP